VELRADAGQVARVVTNGVDLRRKAKAFYEWAFTCFA
jgi:hypothetical protein